MAGLTGNPQDGGNDGAKVPEASVDHDAGVPDSEAPRRDANTNASEGGHDAPSVHDSASESSAVLDAGHHDDTGTQGDAGAADSGVKNDADAHAPMWETLTVVQSKLVSGQSAVAFPNPTTAGTLLVAMVPQVVPPSGSGWMGLASDANHDAMYFWPNNPGGLQAFALSGIDYSVILVEFAGAPADLGIDREADTGMANATVTSLSLTGPAPIAVGELELLYLDTASANSATVVGWTYLGTDGNTNYGWWRTATAGTVSVKANYAAACSGSLLFASVEVH